MVDIQNEIMKVQAEIEDLIKKIAELREKEQKGEKIGFWIFKKSPLGKIRALEALKDRKAIELKSILKKSKVQFKKEPIKKKAA